MILIGVLVCYISIGDDFLTLYPVPMIFKFDSVFWKRIDKSKIQQANYDLSLLSMSKSTSKYESALFIQCFVYTNFVNINKVNLKPNDIAPY
jgi:hypothetical protein